MSYEYPGNVRQLENTIFRAVVLADGNELTVADFPQVAAHVERRGRARAHDDEAGSGGRGREVARHVDHLPGQRERALKEDVSVDVERGHHHALGVQVHFGTIVRKAMRP